MPEFRLTTWEKTGQFSKSTRAFLSDGPQRPGASGTIWIHRQDAGVYIPKRQPNPMPHQTSRNIKLRERKLGREKADGQAWQDSGLIEIDPRQSEQERLDTIVHETLHVLLPDFQEGSVREFSKQIAEVIWKDGWRRVLGLQGETRRQHPAASGTKQTRSRRKQK